jgi:serine/threonine-protein kinase
VSTLESGAEFAGHRIVGELGRGGMGIVYRARHLALDQMRALKVLEPRLAVDERSRARFAREAKLAASIDHPSVVRVHDAGEQDGRMFISMQLVDGVDLGTLLRSTGPLPPRRAISLLAPIAAGLDAAHGAGLVHRDVKPANILIAETPAGERAVLGDFGIGRLIADEQDARLTSHDEVLGTADYMAPEQVEAREVTGSADVYSLACVAFRMLSGSVPFPAETALAVLLSHRSEPRPSARQLNPELPHAADAALAEGMEVDPGRRPQSARAFVRRLEQALGESGTADRAADAATQPLPEVRSTGPHGAERRRRSLLRWGGAALAALAAAGALVYVLAGNDTAGPPPRQAAAVTVDVPRDPISVAPGAEFVWVASGSAGLVTAYDAATGRRGGMHFPITEPRALAIGPGYVWAISADSLYRIATDGGDVDRSDVRFEDAVDVSFEPNGVWVLDRGSPSEAVRIDPATLEDDGSVFVGRGAQAIDAGPGAVWVTNTEDGTVTRIDPESARVDGTAIDVGGRITDIAAGGGQAWVIDNLQGRLTPIALAGGVATAGEPIVTAPRPRAVALGFGSVWVASEQDNTVQRFALDGDHELQGVFKVGKVPADIARGNDRIWTANSGGKGTLSGIDP